MMSYVQEIETRYFDLIIRHGMSSKFDEEDAAGQR